MRHLVFAAVSSLALAACSMSGQDNDTGEETTASADSGSDYGYDTYSDDNLADSMASDDQAMTRTSAEADGNSSNMGSADAIPDPEDRPIMQAQVVLDRIGFGPGVIDGVDSVSGKVSGEFRDDAVWALIAAMLAVALYIWIRFEWQFGVGGLFALFHDVSLTLGMFALFQLEFSLRSSRRFSRSSVIR